MLSTTFAGTGGTLGMKRRDLKLCLERVDHFQKLRLCNKKHCYLFAYSTRIVRNTNVFLNI